jgi:hypothetical protein
LPECLERFGPDALRYLSFGLSLGEVRAQLGDFGAEMAVSGTKLLANTRRVTPAPASAQDAQQTFIEQWPAHAPSRGPRARGEDPGSVDLAADIARGIGNHDGCWLVVMLLPPR